jgi:two-component system NtrC family response regulator
MERMVILRRSDIISPADLPSDFFRPEKESDVLPTVTGPENMDFHENQKKLITDALRKFAGNKSRAARYLKIPRHILTYRIKKYGIS